MLAQTELRLGLYPASAAMAPHMHDTASMNIVVQGGFLERIGSRERSYARGHVAFVPAGMAHSQLFGVSGARQIIFRPQESWLDYLADCRTELAEAPHLNTPVLRQYGDRLLEEMHNDDDFSPAAREGLLLEIVAAFGRTGTAAKTRAAPPSWLKSARDFLHANACSPPGLAATARAAGRHEIHLAREFRRYFGTSVGDYSRQLQIEEAARLLRAARTNICAIALDCGFSSHAHLCRVFKAHFGVTPAQYRSHPAC
jgi:AraC family transcriptional regulator